MNATTDDLHSEWARLFAVSLAQCGVAHAVISPGARSTPLALALAAQLPTTVLHDERVAAFFALGQARASGRASVVLATSGSAPGHWLPAVMEAHEAGLPLLLVSADRPWEVQQAQASQTVDQHRLYGHHANAYFELGLPDAHPAALRAVAADRGTGRARHAVPAGGCGAGQRALSQTARTAIEQRMRALACAVRGRSRAPAHRD